MYKLFKSFKLDTCLSRFIEDLEGFSSTPYRCKAGVSTIGFGTAYSDDGYGAELNAQLNIYGRVFETTARRTLKRTVDAYMHQVFDDVRWLLPEKPSIKETRYQYCALGSLVYNIGPCNMIKAENFKAALFDFFLTGETDQLTDCWNKFVLVQTKPCYILVARRKKELDYFLKYDKS